MIALSTELSRRAAEEAILRGEVAVAGERVTNVATTVDPLKDRVTLRGRPLAIAAHRTYLAFHKPRGTLVTKSDPEGRPTIWEMLPEWKASLNAVGRLDFDSEGLLLLTDDGDFQNQLTHPRHEIWKRYQVRVEGTPSVAALARLCSGVRLSDGMTLPAKVRRLGEEKRNALLEIAIREGRNRQVRRMCEAVGHRVLRLVRVAVGSVTLGNLAPGQSRELTPSEVRSLLDIASR
jgi:23S rRNA pseudouridine2605 synthase